MSGKEEWGKAYGKVAAGSSAGAAEGAPRAAALRERVLSLAGLGSFGLSALGSEVGHFGRGGVRQHRLARPHVVADIDIRVVLRNRLGEERERPVTVKLASATSSSFRICCIFGQGM